MMFGKLALKILFEDYFEVKDADHFSAKFMLKPIDDPHVDLLASVSFKYRFVFYNTLSFMHN